MRLLAVCLAFFLASCATVGNKGLADPQVMSSIVENKTKQTEVQSLLGDPMSMYKDVNGDVVWHYSLAKSQMFNGTSSTNATFRFKNGILVEKTVLNPRY